MKFLNVIPLIFLASVISAEAEPKPKAAPKSKADPIPKAEPKPTADPKPKASAKPIAEPKAKAEPLLIAATKSNFETDHKEKTIFADLTRSGLTRYGQPTLITIPVTAPSKVASSAFLHSNPHQDVGKFQNFQAFQRNLFNNGHINAIYHPEIVSGHLTLPFNAYGSPNPYGVPIFNEPIIDLYGSNSVVGTPLRIHSLGHGHLQTPENLGLFRHPSIGAPIIFYHRLNNFGLNGHEFVGPTLGNYQGNVNHFINAFHDDFVLPSQRGFIPIPFGSHQNSPVFKVDQVEGGRKSNEKEPSSQYGLPVNNQF